MLFLFVGVILLTIMHCAQYLKKQTNTFSLPDSRTVTIHLWEELHTVWISGDGKREWYNTMFQEIYADASNGRLPGRLLLNLPLMFGINILA